MICTKKRDLQISLIFFQVFIAELMRGAGKAWHKGCFTCNLCNKRVDSSNLCEREGEIFCKACYGKNFGPKGFGFGIGAGCLQMTWKKNITFEILKNFALSLMHKYYPNLQNARPKNIHITSAWILWIFLKKIYPL